MTSKFNIERLMTGAMNEKKKDLSKFENSHITSISKLPHIPFFFLEHETMKQTYPHVHCSVNRKRIESKLRKSRFSYKNPHSDNDTFPFEFPTEDSDPRSVA